MRDPSLNMEQSTTMGQQASNGQSEPRRNQQKSARVAFGPDIETHIPPRDRSPPSTTGHHRSFTSVERKQPPIATPGRPTSSSNGESAVDSDSHAEVPSDRASDGGRPVSTLKRAKSDYGPRLGLDNPAAGNDEEDFAIRHGWQEEYTSSEYLKLLHSVSRIATSCGVSLGVLICS